MDLHLRGAGVLLRTPRVYLSRVLEVGQTKVINSGDIDATLLGHGLLLPWRDANVLLEMLRNHTVVLFLHLAELASAVDVGSLALVLLEDLLFTSGVVLVADLFDVRREVLSCVSFVLLDHATVLFTGGSAALVV